MGREGPPLVSEPAPVAPGPRCEPGTALVSQMPHPSRSERVSEFFQNFLGYRHRSQHFCSEDWMRQSTGGVTEQDIEGPGWSQHLLLVATFASFPPLQRNSKPVWKQTRGTADLATEATHSHTRRQMPRLQLQPLFTQQRPSLDCRSTSRGQGGPCPTQPAQWAAEDRGRGRAGSQGHAPWHGHQRSRGSRSPGPWASS